MTTYKYTDESKLAVFIIEDDGTFKTSILTSSLPEGTIIEPADVAPAQPPVNPLEKLRRFLADNPDVAALL